MHKYTKADEYIGWLDFSFECYYCTTISRVFEFPTLNLLRSGTTKMSEGENTSKNSTK